MFAQQMPVSSSVPSPPRPSPSARRDKMDKIKAKTTGTEEALKTTAEEAGGMERKETGGGGMEG